MPGREDGSQQCGDKGVGSTEGVHAVKCNAEATNGELKVVVLVELSKGVKEASFAIDNVNITKITSGLRNAILVAMSAS